MLRTIFFFFLPLPLRFRPFPHPSSLLLSPIVFLISPTTPHPTPPASRPATSGHLVSVPTEKTRVP